MQRLTATRVGFGLVAALYLLSFPYHPALRSPNELCRLWLSRALVEDHTLAINGVLQRYGPVGDLSVKDGLYYPSKAPLLSFLGAPLYALQRGVFGPPVDEVGQVFVARLAILIIPTLVMLVFLRRFLRAYLSEPHSDALVITYALGSMALNYSEMFFSHQLTAVLAFGCFYSCWKALEGTWPRRGLLLGGVFAGAVVACEYTGALTVIAIGFYVAAALWKKEPNPTARVRQLLVAGGQLLIGGAPFLIALMAYHQACFGHPLTSGYKYLNDPGYQGWHVGGFLGIRLPDARAFFLSYFSPLRGLFILSPFLLLGIFGLRQLKQRSAAIFVFTVALVLGNAYFTSSFTYDSWGWTVGPRHLTPMIPFLMLPAGLLMERLGTATHFEARLSLGVAWGLCVTSVLSSTLASFINYVPETTSTSVYGLFWPLFLDGYRPVTALAAFGVRATWPGVLLFVIGLAATAWLGLRTYLATPIRAVTVGLALALVGHQGLQFLLTRDDATDQAHRKFFQSIWFTPPRA